MLLTRIIMGDFLFTATGLLAAAVSLALSLAARWPKWARIAYGLALTVGLAVLMHWGIEAIQTWWVSPLNEPMDLEIP